MKKKYGENEFIEIHQQDNLVILRYKEDANLELYAAIRIFELFSDIVGKERYYILEDLSNLKWIDKQSRDYIAAHPLTNRMYAWASFSAQSIHKIVHMIYITFSKPEIQSRFFPSEKEAMEWLKEMGYKQE